MYKYPYGDSQQLNLDWILAKIKDMEAAEASDLETISKVLISLPYNTTTSYRRYDYAFLNGKLYRCLTDTSGVFNPTAWQEALIGDDLAVLTRWINAIDAAAVVDVKFDTSGTNGKLQQKYHDEYHDVVEVDYAPVQNSKRPLSSNAGYELNGAITSNNTKILNTQNALAKNITSVVATETLKKGDFRFNRTDGRLWRITDTIQTGESIIGGSNAQSLAIGSVFEGFFMGNAIIEFSGGAGWIYDDRIAGTNSAIIVQFRYENGGDSGATAGAKTFILTSQVPQAGAAVVYVRNPDGTTPANMKLYCSYLISNYT